MIFLQGVAAKLLQWLLAKGATLSWAWLKYIWARNKDHSELKKKIEKLEKAETPEDIDNAFKDVINHF